MSIASLFLPTQETLEFYIEQFIISPSFHLWAQKLKRKFSLGRYCGLITSFSVKHTPEFMHLFMQQIFFEPGTALATKADTFLSSW